MYEYTRAVFFYETDKMGVVHHSNYARWLEEARDAYFNAVDLAYTVTESFGVACPVTDMSLKFKLFARYGDSFTVRVRMTKYTGVRFYMAYTVVNQDGEILLMGESGHAFVSAENQRPVSLAHAIPARHEALKKLVEPGE